ncbi:TPA: hypothetical protein ACH3X1_013346 [Trebouxia sp. C0004]
MRGAPLRYFKTAYSKARKQGQAALDAFCEWDNFVAWCEKTLNMRDHEKRAFDVLASLQQTGTVSDYKSKIDDFAARVETTEKMLLLWWLQGLQSHVREQCIRDPRTNQPFVLLEDSQDAALAATSYDDNSTTGVGSLSTTTKKQRTNSGTAQPTGYKSAVQQPTRPGPRAHRMQVCGTPQNLLKGIGLDKTLASMLLLATALVPHLALLPKCHLRLANLALPTVAGRMAAMATTQTA